MRKIAYTGKRLLVIKKSSVRWFIFISFAWAARNFPLLELSGQKLWKIFRFSFTLETGRRMFTWKKTLDGRRNLKEGRNVSQERYQKFVIQYFSEQKYCPVKDESLWNYVHTYLCEFLEYFSSKTKRRCRNVILYFCRTFFHIESPFLCCTHSNMTSCIIECRLFIQKWPNYLIHY